MTDEDPVAAWLRGEISPHIALARLLLSDPAPDRLLEQLRRHGESAASLLETAEQRRPGLDRAADMLRRSGAAHDWSEPAPAPALARIAATFDAAVAIAPEASVALFSLADPALLAAATAELTAWLDDRGLLEPHVDALDVGCGIGRMAAALAPRVRSVLGLDVSSGMIAEARHRTTTLRNVRFACADGQDLTALSDQSFDLILAVDSFPYIIQAGVGDAHARDAARILRPGGSLAIFNLSYRTPAQDRADALRWAGAFGLELACAGERSLALWDGAAWLLHKPVQVLRR